VPINAAQPIKLARPLGEILISLPSSNPFRIQSRQKLESDWFGKSFLPQRAAFCAMKESEVFNVQTCCDHLGLLMQTQKRLCDQRASVKDPKSFEFLVRRLELF
jgi:hypothetical protein